MFGYTIGQLTLCVKQILHRAYENAVTEFLLKILETIDHNVKKRCERLLSEMAYFLSAYWRILTASEVNDYEVHHQDGPKCFCLTWDYVGDYGLGFPLFVVCIPPDTNDIRCWNHFLASFLDLSFLIWNSGSRTLLSIPTLIQAIFERFLGGSTQEYCIVSSS